MSTVQLSDSEWVEFRHSLSLAGGGVRECFQLLSARCLARYVRSNAGIELDPEPLRQCCGAIWNIVDAHGWPQPLSRGAEREATDTELPELPDWTERVLRSFAGTDPDKGKSATDTTGQAVGGGKSQAMTLLKVAVGQLFKACFYPEITVCRNSYRQQTADGRCKRQNPTAARARLSGSPCVDCPWTVRLSAEEHARLLTASWAPANSIPFDSDPMCFLPEDFRSLRRFLWLHARTRTNAP